MEAVVLSPSWLLCHRDGTRIEDALKEKGSYYTDFRQFLSDPATERGNYLRQICSPPIVNSTIMRAQCILMAKRFGISFDEARSLIDFWPDVIAPEAAANIVMDNYIAMMHDRKRYAVFGEMDAYGRIIVIEGVHRSIINMMNGFDTPVMIGRRSDAWVEFVTFFRRESVSLYNREELLYHGIDHPDFAKFNVIREDRSAAIIAALSRHEGLRRGLDLGCMIGFYTHRLARAGFTMTAVEYESKYVDAFERLAVLYDSSAKVTKSNIYDFSFESVSVDFIVALSIVYHLLRDDERRCLDLVEVMKSRAKCVIVDTEPRTGLLSTDRLLSIFAEYAAERIFEGIDGRDVYCFCREG